jgi:hypothetical protein
MSSNSLPQPGSNSNHYFPTLPGTDIYGRTTTQNSTPQGHVQPTQDSRPIS